MADATIAAPTELRLDLDALRRQHCEGLDASALVRRVCRRIAALQPDPAWIAVRPEPDILADAQALMQRDPQRRLPLHGVPYAVKDNIDVAGMPTTAGCPAFAYAPQRSATVVERLTAAGAILVGKTNLDQFATGLVGTRSPFGAVPNVFDADYICGGSSSGSASVVARGLVSFALGTDTAGSGRIPAGYCNIVGFKPTRGRVSMAGVVPACRSLDCVSIFALTAVDAYEVLTQIDGRDGRDAWQRPRETRATGAIRRVGVPEDPDFRGDDAQKASYEAALRHCATLGLELQPIDFTPFSQVARMLYDGPWVAERYAAIREFFDRHASDLDATVRGIVAGARRYSAADLFEAQDRLAGLRQRCESALTGLDALLVPTAPTIHRIDDVARDPIALNSDLGYYTNFVNLLDLSALALPAAFRSDGLPAGITFIARAWQEPALVHLGRCWQASTGLTLGRTGTPAPRPAGPRGTPEDDCVDVAVVGAHLSGMPLNFQLTERRAARVEVTATAPHYRLYALQGGSPPKPGLQRVASGRSIEVEVWRMPLVHFGSFVAAVPPPLAIGSVELHGGRWVKGFVCEGYALDGATDITAHGGWRSYLGQTPDQSNRSSDAAH